MKDERLTFEEVVDTATYFVFFNTQDELFKNANIRRAFSSAINREELADVMTYCIMLADKINVQPEKIILEKLEKTKKKYPVEKAKGKSTKYNKL